MEQTQEYKPSKNEVDDMFAELVSNHGRKLRNIINAKVFCPSDRDDVYQNALIAVYTALPRFRHECSTLSFAQRCFYNVVNSYIKSRRIRKIALDDGVQILAERTDKLEKDAAIVPIEKNNPEILYSMRVSSIENIVDNALLLLEKKSPEQAEIYQVMLDFFREYDYQLSDQELSGIIEVPVNTIKTRKYRARQKLREIIEEEDWYWP